MLNNFYICGPTSMKLICPLEGFQILPFLKTFVTDFSEPKKARKLKVHINIDNDWMYCVYWKRGKGSVVMFLDSFSFSTNLCLSPLMAL